MKVYKVELMIIDFDELGAEEIKEQIENVRYPNRCISPQVMKMGTRDIGEWDDYHPLNNTNTLTTEYERLFKMDESE